MDDRKTDESQHCCRKVKRSSENVFNGYTQRYDLKHAKKLDESIKTGKISDRVGVELLLIQFSQK